MKDTTQSFPQAVTGADAAGKKQRGTKGEEDLL